MRSTIVILLFGLIAICCAQFDGRYRPPSTTPRYRPFRTQNRYSSGRYTDNSGRYTGDNAGRYSGDPGRYRGNNDGRYVPDPNAGKYVHKDDPYKHKNVGGGDYRGDPGRYVHDSDAGKYVHDDNPYKHLDVGGGQYVGSPDKQNPYKGQKDKQYPYKDKNYGGDGGAGGAYDPNAGAGAGAGGAKRPGSGYKPSRGKGDYGSFQKEYDIIHLARKGYRDGYHYTYETANGILAEETSQDAVVSQDGSSSSSKAGWYEYTGPDGKLYHVDYTAGENGFEPKADHIPTIPPLIQKALDWLKAHEDTSKN
ncbi:larval cuticle protein LCP-30-like [Ctenocephalides felis]|uniref:larval cuticle protein LCP-30-like n=1 Tax=Ctenocephalides felis TaxID=7515 RepID=UPI000E6E477A|nr:larval cuticle protein LCP-30-like [Ctenocephalides felis]